ncbi:hypothetical protein OFB78_31190, partial [Escherichia coli]|nr:hypothetical protein [Escherichia coli]
VRRKQRAAMCGRAAQLATWMFLDGWTRDGIWMVLAEDWGWSPGEGGGLEAIRKSSAEMKEGPLKD